MGLPWFGVRSRRDADVNEVADGWEEKAARRPQLIADIIIAWVQSAKRRGTRKMVLGDMALGIGVCRFSADIFFISSLRYRNIQSKQFKHCKHHKHQLQGPHFLKVITTLYSDTEKEASTYFPYKSHYSLRERNRYLSKLKVKKREIGKGVHRMMRNSSPSPRID